MKYQVRFKKLRQVDGWTDPANDLEYDTVSETITVEAKNEKLARRAACRKAYGWTTYIYPRNVKWTEEDIKSIKRK